MELVNYWAILSYLVMRFLVSFHAHAPNKMTLLKENIAILLKWDSAYYHNLIYLFFFFWLEASTVAFLINRLLTW